MVKIVVILMNGIHILHITIHPNPIKAYTNTNAHAKIPPNTLFMWHTIRVCVFVCVCSMKWHNHTPKHIPYLNSSCECNYSFYSALALNKLLPNESSYWTGSAFDWKYSEIKFFISFPAVDPLSLSVCLALILSHFSNAILNHSHTYWLTSWPAFTYHEMNRVNKSSQQHHTKAGKPKVSQSVSQNGCFLREKNKNQRNSKAKKRILNIGKNPSWKTDGVVFTSEIQ